MRVGSGASTAWSLSCSSILVGLDSCTSHEVNFLQEDGLFVGVFLCSLFVGARWRKAPLSKGNPHGPWAIHDPGQWYSSLAWELRVHFRPMKMIASWACPFASFD